jgi:hypothetical protein
LQKHARERERENYGEGKSLISLITLIGQIRAHAALSERFAHAALGGGGISGENAGFVIMVIMAVPCANADYTDMIGA